MGKIKVGFGAPVPEWLRLLRREREKERKREWRETYEAYLDSDGWRRLRAKVIERAGGPIDGVCERKGCEAVFGKVGVEVHHRTYRRLGHEWTSDLEALCPACHREVHGYDRVEGELVRVGEEYVI